MERRGEAYVARVKLPEVSVQAARSVGELRPWRSPERAAMGELLASWPWRIFCTWQFKDRIGEDGAVREIRWWLGLVAFAFGGNGRMGWMIGVEQDLGAAWPHAHGLICGERLAAQTTVYKGKPHEKTVPLIEPFWLAWKERHGGGEFRVIGDDGRRCSLYCAKYSAKRGAVLFSAGLEKFRGSPPAAAVTLFPEDV